MKIYNVIRDIKEIQPIYIKQLNMFSFMSEYNKDNNVVNYDIALIIYI